MLEYFQVATKFSGKERVFSLEKLVEEKDV
jgi:hypothetical protein